MAGPASSSVSSAGELDGPLLRWRAMPVAVGRRAESVGEGEAGGARLGE